MNRTIIALLALWAAFSAFGILLHQRAMQAEHPPMMKCASVAGLDGEVYMRRFCNIYGIFRMRKRHPAEGIVTAPLYVIGSSVEQNAGLAAAQTALIVFSAAIATITVYLLYLVTASWGAVAIWTSFAYVWLLASAPELFAASQMFLIATLLMVKRKVRDYRAWVAMTLLAGGTTITNFVKPVVAWGTLAMHDRQLLQDLRSKLFRLGIGMIALILLGAAVEVGKWVFIDGMSAKQEILMGCDYVTKWLATGFGFQERLWRTWEMFFCEPMMTHGAIFGHFNEQGLDVLPLGYRCILPHLVCITIGILCGWSAWKNRRDAVVQALLAMVSFDFGLHVVIGWGMCEAQIYCGHWFFAIPILLSKISGRIWKFALTAVIIGWNAFAIIGA